MKEKRGLSGIYFRSKVNGKFENIVFEDLPDSEQDVILDKNSDWVKSLAKQLANTINEIGDKFDIVRE